MKTCGNCGITKGDSEFYKRRRNSNTLKSNCRKCCSAKSNQRNKKLALEGGPSRRSYYKKKTEEKKISTNKKYLYQVKYLKCYPEKKAANNAVTRANLRIQGFHAHHWNYNKAFRLDVIHLDRIQHVYIHKFLSYDQALFIYRDINGNILDTKEKHLEYINNLIQSKAA